MRSLIPGTKEAGSLHQIPVLTSRPASISRKQLSRLARPQAKASTVQIDEKEILEEPTAKLEVKKNGSKGTQDIEVDAVLAKELNENGESMPLRSRRWNVQGCVHVKKSLRIYDDAPEQKASSLPLIEHTTATLFACVDSNCG